MGKARDLARVIVDSGGLIAAGNLGNAVPADGSITNAKIASVAASKLTGVLPDANAPSGSVIQVVEFTNDGNTSTYSSNDWQEMFNASITPISASNRILIWYQCGVGTSNYSPTSARIRRNSTVIGINLGYTSGTARYSNTAAGMFRSYSPSDDINMMHGSWVDSPNTTSSITYRIDVSPRNDDGTKSWRLNGPWNSGDAGFIVRTPSILRLMEIAA
jgi:hypothetical protein